MNERKDNYVIWVVLIVVLFFVLTCLSGCHTISGFGQDLQDMTQDYTEGGR